MSVQAISWKVQSESDSWKHYTVLRTEDGEYSCTCPDYLFRKHECKHIRKAIRNPYWYDRTELSLPSEQPRNMVLNITLSTGYVLRVTVPEGTTITKIEID